jgi:hypothetical protein
VGDVTNTENRIYTNAQNDGTLTGKYLYKVCVNAQNVYSLSQDSVLSNVHWLTVSLINVSIIYIVLGIKSLRIDFWTIDTE